MCELLYEEYVCVCACVIESLSESHKYCVCDSIVSEEDIVPNARGVEPCRTRCACARVVSFNWRENLNTATHVQVKQV